MKGIFVVLIVLVLIAAGIIVYAGASKDNSGTSGNVVLIPNTSEDSGQTTSPDYTPPASSPPESNPSISNPQTYSVNLKNFAFVPGELKIHIGDSVTWTNQDSVMHTVTSDSGSELSSKSLSNGQSYTHTFTTAGTYNYHCSPHPYMTGTIIVE
jgi:amicyanin